MGNTQWPTTTKKDWTIEVVADDATERFVASLAGSIVRFRNMHWDQQYMYASGSSFTYDTRHVCVNHHPSESVTEKIDWLVERVPGTTNQIRLRNVYWNYEYLY